MLDVLALIPPHTSLPPVQQFYIYTDLSELFLLLTFYLIYLCSRWDADGGDLGTIYLVSPETS